MIIFQLIIYCLIFTGMVRFSVRNGAIEGLYYYPETVQERAIKIGLISRDEMIKKKRIFMTEFYIVMLTSLVLIIGLWDHISDFGTAYIYALVFLEVMNWYDGIVIDKIWVGYSKFWILPGCEDLPYIQTIRQMVKKRLFLTLIWILGAAIVAGVVVLIFGSVR